MKVGVFTNSRSEYSHLYSVMKKIKESNKLKLKTIISGMHLLHEFGYSKEQIIADGFEIDYEIQIPKYRDSISYMAEVSGIITSKIGNICENKEIDILLVLGDRFETLSAVLGAFISNIPIAHIAGGDLSGNIDDSIRHAITKLSHLHFCLTEKSAERVKSLGEESWRISVVGSSSLDNLYNLKNLLSEDEIRLKYGIPSKEQFILFVQHPETGYNREGKQQDQILTTLNVVKKLNLYSVFIYPNYEVGGSIIIKQLEKLSNKKFIKIFKNLPIRDYFSLLKSCFFIVGNSSSGIIESSSLNKPAINLGTRQLDRERDVNVIDLPFDEDEILETIVRLLKDEDYYKKYSKSNHIYGKGDSAGKIVSVLEELPIDSKLVNKRTVSV